MADTLQRLLQLLAALFAESPLPVAVLVSVVLLGVTLWAASAARHSFRILRALAKAPLADLGSDATGLVKVRGTAQPPPAPPGFSPATQVWHRRRTRDGSRGTTTATVGRFLIQDDHGVCAVDAEEAVVVATTHQTRTAFMNSSRSVSDESIRAGDSLTALGELRRDLPAPPDVGGVRCQLKRSGGVLLVSGAPERQVKVLFGLWFAVQFPIALAGSCVLAFGALVQLGLRAADDDNAATRIVGWMLSTEHLEPPSQDAERKLLAISPPAGLQLSAPPVADYAAEGWMRVDLAAVSMYAPPGWVVTERDESTFPTVVLVSPGNDAAVELRVLADALRRPGIALEDALQHYASAKERADRGVVLGYAPLTLDGAVGHVEIMNSGGTLTEADGSPTARNNSYRGAKRIGETVFTVELRMTFAQADQEKFGPLALNVMRSLRFNAP